jgi:hypothetical protein
MSDIFLYSGAVSEMYCSKFFCVFKTIALPPVIPAAKLNPMFPRMTKVPPVMYSAP